MKTIIACLFTLVFFISCSGIKKIEEQPSSYSGHGSQSLPQNILERYAPTPLEDELTSKLEALMEVRQPSSGIMSEKGDFVLFNWTVSGLSHIWRQDLSGGLPIQLTGGVQSARLVGLSPKGDVFYFSRDQNGDEYYGLYEMDVTGGQARVIVAKDRVMHGLQYISDDNNTLFYFANDKRPQDYTLYRFDRSTQESTLLFDRPGFWRVADHHKDGRTLVVRYKSNVSSEFYEIEEKTGEINAVLGVEDDHDYQVVLTSNPKEYLVRTNRFGEFHRVFLFNRDTLTFTPLSEDRDYDVTGISLVKDRTRLLLSVNDQGYSRIEAYSYPEMKKLTIPSVADDEIDSISWGATTRNGRYSTFSVNRAGRAPETGFIDWQKNHFEMLSMASLPEISISMFARDELDFYTTRDGVRIPMFVRRPVQCQNQLCPVIVNFHGGPESQARPGFYPYLQAYLDAGFIYVRPNVRGSRGYGKTWLDADNGPKRLDVLSDIADAGVYIKEHWAQNGVSPKVGVMGGSYGGYATFIAMTKYAGVYDAGVASVGMSSLVTFLQNTADYRRALRESEYGSLEKDYDSLVALSPITYFDQLKDPLMIIHGATDPRVPAGEAVQMKTLMDQKGVEGELLLFADEGHGIRKRENRVLGIGHTLRFFEKYLKP
jgi:dipeptidyl aminopeptidase/acylaminoacyl peptidase